MKSLKFGNGMPLYTPNLKEGTLPITDEERWEALRELNLLNYDAPEGVKKYRKTLKEKMDLAKKCALK